MRTCRTTLVVLLALVSVEVRAQGFAFALFERYLEPLRLQTRIPGLAGIITQNGNIVWAAGLGQADVERNVHVSVDRTPFFIADLSQTLGATLLMQLVERGELTLDDPIGRWTSRLPEPGATVRQALTHTTTGSYRYDPLRFSALTPVIEHHADEPYRRTLAREVLQRAAMFDSSPGYDYASPSTALRDIFAPDVLARYQDVLSRMAVPYRVDFRGRPVRVEFDARGLDASTGVVATAADLARFDAALDEGVLLDRAVVGYMQGGAQPGTPNGLGWFVQAYNGERLVWHFGSVPGAYSSMILKVPSRNLTLILLANSDGLAEPFALPNGDITASLFAKLFLRVFLS